MHRYGNFAVFLQPNYEKSVGKGCAKITVSRWCPYSNDNFRWSTRVKRAPYGCPLSPGARGFAHPEPIGVTPLPRGPEENLKKSIKGILYNFEKKWKILFFKFFDENLLFAWFKDERPQGLSWQSALKGYYTILWQKYKNRFFRFFPCENGFGII